MIIDNLKLSSATTLLSGTALALALSFAATAQGTGQPAAPEPPESAVVGQLVSELALTLSEIEDPQERTELARSLGELARANAPGDGDAAPDGSDEGPDAAGGPSEHAAVGIAVSEIAKTLNEIEDPEERLALARSLVDVARGASLVELPDRPDLPDVVSAPERPERPDLAELPELPELPALPELPELPERPERPDLPARPGG